MATVSRLTCERQRMSTDTKRLASNGAEATSRLEVEREVGRYFESALQRLFLERSRKRMAPSLSIHVTRLESFSSLNARMQSNKSHFFHVMKMIQMMWIRTAKITSQTRLDTKSCRPTWALAAVEL